MEQNNNTRRVISLLVDNSNGVLARISSLFCRRGFNIDSLTVSATNDPSVSRITVTLRGTEQALNQLILQTERLEVTRQIFELDPDKSLQRELLLLKVECDTQNRAELREISSIYKAKIIDLSPDSMIFELTGKPDKIDAFLTMFKGYNILELCRTGVTALERGGKHVAVATLGSEDAMFVSTIRRYALDQETAVSACVLDDSLLYELSSFGGTLVAVTDDRFLALSGDGSLGGSYDYAYPYLRGSTLGGTDFGALVLSRYRSGSAGKLVTVGAEGNLIASLDTQRDVLDISAAGKYLAVLYSDELVIYTSDLAEYASLTDTQYARGVRMRADGSAVLLGSQHGWLFVP